MATQTEQYNRNTLQSAVPPAIPVRYFYTSPLAIDDPLSPLPPPTTAATAARRHPARPFSEFDNAAINKAWIKVRKRIFQYNEEMGGEKNPAAGTPPATANKVLKEAGREGHEPITRDDGSQRTPGREIPSRRSSSRGQYSRSAEVHHRDDDHSADAESMAATLPTSVRFSDSVDSPPGGRPAITGTPFIRAPSRKNLMHMAPPERTEASRRPATHEVDSYTWDESMEPALSGYDGKKKQTGGPPREHTPAPSAKVPVGISRLHHVVMEPTSIRMEPIYWSPVNDVAEVIRGTWFYKDTMLPVEVDVANMLEAGYIDLQPWTQTWNDELNSAIEAGAAGEMKILHKLWPDNLKNPHSHPATSVQTQSIPVHGSASKTEVDREEERRLIVESACDVLDISTGSDGPDNKASGDRSYSHDGRKNIYRQAGVIYANAKEAYLLKPALQPSEYYGRRPLASYIRKGRSIGICVTRGFDQQTWDKLHPIKRKVQAGASTPQATATTRSRQTIEPDVGFSERPQVSDLVLVIHGIGQKLSERIETYHFTHAINGFRREVNVELAAADTKRRLRADAKGIMVLPVRYSGRPSVTTD